jgi:phosphoribosylformylglycinamidine synthase
MNAITLAPTDVETAKRLGLTAEEFHRIEDLLGRNPNFTELSLYSVMWSEHCSYKNSIVQLKTLPRTGLRVLAEAGSENAGLLDIGDGLAVCFKIESHNHPSAIEPYQGAATGVGGIHRDIFTMGARPIAALNSLRFGNPSSVRTRQLIMGVVRGIGDYGNSFGVPTVGGEVYFDPAYEHNPLVNAMSVGVVRTDSVIRGVAEGIGNPVFIVGSATGKDGIHGATFASQELNASSAEQLPAVQVGDPFQEKLLLEATLEVAATGAVIGMQDMGAAGIGCSTSEMAARGGVGMRIYLDRVPTRQANMLPFELLLSESQERMLVVAQRGREHEVLAVFDRWNLPCVQIGEVITGNDLEYWWHGELVARLPASSLVLGGGAPVYVREQSIPAYFAANQAFDLQRVQDIESSDVGHILFRLLGEPSIARKTWITRQYDATVGASTISHNRPTECAVVRLQGTSRALAMTVDCNARYVWADPERGAMLAVAEAARNLCCTGAKPLGITNCLNFGNPYHTDIYWQFAQSIKGMGAACRAFYLPVTGGNVSFYNHTSEQGAVLPTPTIGMVGLIDDLESQLMTISLKKPEHKLLVLGNLVDDLASSFYCRSILGIENSLAPYIDLSEELTLQTCLLQLIEMGIVESAHDVSDGGLLVALCESAMAGGLGFEVQRPNRFRRDAFWFGESGGRVVISCRPDLFQEVEAVCQQHACPVTEIGIVRSDPQIWVEGLLTADLSSLQSVYNHSLEQALGFKR